MNIDDVLLDFIKNAPGYDNSVKCVFPYANDSSVDYVDINFIVSLFSTHVINHAIESAPFGAVFASSTFHFPVYYNASYVEHTKKEKVSKVSRIIEEEVPTQIVEANRFLGLMDDLD
jgi:hypothetical protein